MSGRAHRARRVPAAALLVALLAGGAGGLAACSRLPQEPSPATPAGSATPGHPPSAAALRDRLDRVWQERAFLGSELVRTAGSGSETGLAAAQERLASNTAEAASLLAPSLDSSHANAFESLFAKQDRLTADYARALASGNAGAIADARSTLERDSASLSDAMAGNNGQVGRHVLRSLLDEQAHQMELQGAAQAAGRTDEALAAAALQVEYGVEIGDHLARGFALRYPDLYPGSTEAPDVSRRQSVATSVAAQAYAQAAAASVRRGERGLDPTSRTLAVAAAGSLANASGVAPPPVALQASWVGRADAMAALAAAEVGRDQSAAARARADLDRNESVAAELLGPNSTAPLSAAARGWEAFAGSIAGDRAAAAYADLSAVVDSSGALANAVLPDRVPPGR